MWGTPWCLRKRFRKVRFIPTHVGNTVSKRFCVALVTVHPHACGEHSKTILLVNPFLGSSPRMWGTRSRAVPT